MKPATIKLYKSLLTSEIDGLTFKRVDGVLSAETLEVKNALSTDAEEPLDASILLRMIDARSARIRRKISFSLQKETEDDLVVTNEMDSQDFIDYKINVPDSFDKQKLKTLAQMIHNYIVQGVLVDWYANQNLKGNVTAESLEEMECEIACMLRSSFVKRPLQPFGPR